MDNTQIKRLKRPPRKDLCLPALEKPCHWCQSKVIVKYVPPKKSYAQLNNWGYWTEKEENNDKYICRTCIRQLYYERPQDYYTSITTEKKRKEKFFPANNFSLSTAINY